MPPEPKPSSVLADAAGCHPNKTAARRGRSKMYFAAEIDVLRVAARVARHLLQQLSQVPRSVVMRRQEFAVVALATAFALAAPPAWAQRRRHPVRPDRAAAVGRRVGRRFSRPAGAATVAAAVLAAAQASSLLLAERPSGARLVCYVPTGRRPSRCRTRPSARRRRWRRWRRQQPAAVRRSARGAARLERRRQRQRLAAAAPSARSSTTSATSGSERPVERRPARGAGLQPSPRRPPARSGQAVPAHRPAPRWRRRRYYIPGYYRYGYYPYGYWGSGYGYGLGYFYDPF